MKSLGVKSLHSSKKINYHDYRTCVFACLPERDWFGDMDNMTKENKGR